MKDHQIAAVVNELRDIAVQFHGAQQLRERIAHVIVPLLKDAERLCNAKQAEIDRLMLEFCPDEMTKEQFATWAASQRVVPDSELIFTEYRIGNQAEYSAAVAKRNDFELPQPYAGAITLLETIAEHGALAKFDDGMPTPNSVLCKRFAEQLRAIAHRAGSAQADIDKAVSEAVAPLNRANLELTRRYEEQKLQEKRMETALERAMQPDSERDAARICHLIGSIFFAGDFVAETENERELEQLLIKTGYRYRSWGEIDVAMAASSTNKELK